MSGEGDGQATQHGVSIDLPSLLMFAFMVLFGLTSAFYLYTEVAP